MLHSTWSISATYTTCEGTTYSTSMHWQAMTLFQLSVFFGRSPASLTVLWTRLRLSRCLRGTGDMQLQVKVQDCQMFLLQEEHPVHCSMWMWCSRSLQPSWPIDIFLLCPLLYPSYMYMDNCVKIASNVRIVYLKGLKRTQLTSAYAKKNIPIEANITQIECISAKLRIKVQN